VLPEFWGLPESQMLERRAGVTLLPRLATLDTEATLLHAVVHCTSHLFSHGLKAAWDVGECLQAAEIDWERLWRWVDQMPAPRAFWSLFGVFNRDLGFRAPDQFLARAPRDLKQLRLETIASRRAFSATDVAEELNPFSKNAVFLMLCDRSSARMRLLFSLIGRNAVEARKSGWQYVARQSSTPLPKQLRRQWAEAWDQWKHYRAVVGSPQFRERAGRAASSRA
jgi:hypothetical protein